MTLYARESVLSRLEELVPDGNPDRVEHSAYELGLGGEVYTTDERVPIQHKQSDPVVVGAGQFALLHTQEVVRIPSDLLAFLSIKYRIKRRGLVNVSGFHVDPGYEGQLIFSVFNAGPRDITLRVGAPTFLIWFAEMNGPTDKCYGVGPSDSRLPIDAVNDIRPSTRRGHPISLASLDSQVGQLRSRVDTLIGLTVTAGVGLFLVLLAVAISA